MNIQDHKPIFLYDISTAFMSIIRFIEMASNNSFQNICFLYRS